MEDEKKTLSNIHKKLKIKGGSFSGEYQEQLMIAKFLDPDSTVLEIGANIGRTSLVIASILKDSEKFVTFECNPFYAKILTENRNINGFKFHIEDKAISLQPVYYNASTNIKKTRYKCIDESCEEYNSNKSQHYCNKEKYIKGKIISYAQVRDKYNNFNFDTLILDCEGAFYPILKNEPLILDNINTVIIENDFAKKEYGDFVHSEILKRGLKLVYSRPYGSSKPDFPFKNYFYQVYKK